ncbi:hypothetical protein J3E73DRAFT_357962 [Bipolaris maydis]|nr:hypothetical protein J3E73DRAFT_357962 [Bipolaris maydis]
MFGSKILAVAALALGVVAHETTCPAPTTITITVTHSITGLDRHQRLRAPLSVSLALQRPMSPIPTSETAAPSGPTPSIAPSAPLESSPVPSGVTTVPVVVAPSTVVPSASSTVQVPPASSPALPEVTTNAAAVVAPLTGLGSLFAIGFAALVAVV